MPNCQIINHATSHRAPLPLSFLSWILETALAQVVCFFDALERLLPPYLAIVTTVCIVWSVDQYQFLSGIMFGVPLGLVMALVYGIAIVSAMFLLGVLLWLTLVPIYLIASNRNWQLPTVLEHNHVVAHRLHSWAQGKREQLMSAPQSTIRQLAELAIAALLGRWLMD